MTDGGALSHSADDFAREARRWATLGAAGKLPQAMVRRNFAACLLAAAFLAEPEEDSWVGLARQIVLWCDLATPTGSALYTHLSRTGREAPAWLKREIPDDGHVPSKGTVAVCIFKAMREATVARVVRSLKAPVVIDPPNTREPRCSSVHTSELTKFGGMRINSSLGQ
jgi:hypothetical protein